MKHDLSAFSRARTMMAAISAMIAQGLKGIDLQQGIGALGPYESRGKGGKSPHRRVGTKAYARAALKRQNQRRNRAACKGGR